MDLNVIERVLFDRSEFAAMLYVVCHLHSSFSARRRCLKRNPLSGNVPNKLVCRKHIASRSRPLPQVRRGIHGYELETLV